MFFRFEDISCVSLHLLSAGWHGPAAGLQQRQFRNGEEDRVADVSQRLRILIFSSFLFCDPLHDVRNERSHIYWCVLSTFRVIPPEQQAEADELAAALSELQAATMHECQEVVRGDETEY